MDQQKLSKLKNKKRNKLSRSRVIEKDSTDQSSTDEKSDEDLEEVRDLSSSKLQLLKKKRVSKSANKSKTEQQVVVPKETSIAKSIKRKLSFFKKSSSKDKTTILDHEVSESNKSSSTLDVIVDVHHRNDENEITRQIEKSDEKINDHGVTVKDSLDLIEEYHEEQVLNTLSNSDSEAEIELTGDNSEKSVILPIFEGGGVNDAHKRKRWDKSEIAAEEIVEDLKKQPRRRQWAKGGGTSAQLRDTSGKKIVVPNKSANVETAKNVRPKSSMSVYTWLSLTK